LSSSGPVAQTERNFLDRIPHPISCLISIALVRNSLKVFKDHQTSNPSVSHRKMDLCKKERRFSVYESCGVGRSGFSHRGGASHVTKAGGKRRQDSPQEEARRSRRRRRQTTGVQPTVHRNRCYHFGRRSQSRDTFFPTSRFHKVATLSLKRHTQPLWSIMHPLVEHNTAPVGHNTSAHEA
jgi:hypothetical protein